MYLAMRPIDRTPAEAYRHGVLGSRPAEGDDACLHGAYGDGDLS